MDTDVLTSTDGHEIPFMETRVVEWQKHQAQALCSVPRWIALDCLGSPGKLYSEHFWHGDCPIVRSKGAESTDPLKGSDIFQFAHILMKLHYNDAACSYE